MRLSVLFPLLLLISSISFGAPKKCTVSGYVYEEGGHKPIVNATVYVIDNQLGTVTNDQGYFAITVPVTASLKVSFSFVGFSTLVKNVSFSQDIKLAIYLTPGQFLTEQIVRAARAGNVSNDATMSTISITGAQLRKVPALLGEKDPLKMLQLMPGVQKGSEGNAGLYVRGGSPDGNLILLDDAPIYNPNHLLGFFSAFNGDVLKQVDLTKGGFPARFGGRLSSVVELTTKDGTTDKLHGEGSLGLVASRLTLQGPLVSPKVSFLVAGRRTYLDLLTGLMPNSNSAQPTTKSYFYDLNAKVSIDAGAADKISLSAYTSQDQFLSVRDVGATKMQSALTWSNLAGSARWNHRFAGGTTANLSLIYSQYKMGVSDQQSLSPTVQNQLYTLRYQSGIRDLGLKYDINQYVSGKHQFQYGIQVTHHQFTPEATIVAAQDTLPQKASNQTINALEAGVYIEHYWQPTDRLRINSGMRLSYYSVLAAATPQATATNPGSGAFIRPEPRLSVAYKLSSTLALKGSYALMNQYVHLLSSTGIGLSTDLWMPTVDNIKPQQSQQVALGLAKDLPESGLTFTVEGYYKQMQNLLSYKEGASFLSTDSQGSANASNWTNNVTSGQGWSYGTELLLQKRAGRLSGWLGYTLSWTQWQFAELNGGKRFNPRYDRRHDASAVLIYELTPSITLAGTWVYGTGNALTMPLARYSGFTNTTQTSARPSSALLYGDGPNVKEYGDRNSFRAAPYHRLDVSIQFNKKKGNYERTWELSVYNVYNRHNAFLYSLEGKDQGKDLPSKTVLYKYSLFPIVPSASYIVRF
ncbi:TonB-dependent receptor [Spirosoma flavum]|uniref:TonB-dependent receptor domain-containing protein n=1 Tax=Spirosoma flavum TaxID=2048557 RepID=A0ABW6AMJ9_9BACT